MKTTGRCNLKPSTIQLQNRLENVTSIEVLSNEQTKYTDTKMLSELGKNKLE